MMKPVNPMTSRINQSGVRWSGQVEKESSLRHRTRDDLVRAIQNDVQLSGYAFDTKKSTLILTQQPVKGITPLPLEAAIGLVARHQLVHGPVEPYFGFDTLRIHAPHPTWDIERLRETATWAPWHEIVVQRIAQAGVAERSIRATRAVEQREIDIDVRSGDVATIARATAEHLAEMAIAGYMLGAQLLIRGSREQALEFQDALMFQPQFRPTTSYRKLKLGSLGAIALVAALVAEYKADCLQIDSPAYYIGATTATILYGVFRILERPKARAQEHRRMLCMPPLTLFHTDTRETLGVIRTAYTTRFGGFILDRTSRVIPQGVQSVEK